MRISASWTSARLRQIAETIETLQENEDQARDHFSKTKQTGIVPSADMQGVLLLVCGWRDVQNWKKPTTLAIQLKLSRCAEDEEFSAYAVLRNRFKPAKLSKRKVLASIGEDMRTVSRNTDLTTHSELVEYRVRLELSRECSVS